ncbi:MAG: HEAT repeat domain-containing protein [Candidatus Obscuribacterales bacterium]|nr:HEAT repeat domain-containing protein [Candidatus Obscuribacterales bacterium]
MGDDSKKPESKDSQKSRDLGLEPLEEDKDLASERLFQDSWGRNKPPEAVPAPPQAKAETALERVEKTKPFGQKDDSEICRQFDRWVELSRKGGNAISQLQAFEKFLPQINFLIKDQNSLTSANVPQLNTERFSRVVSVLESYQKNKDALAEALKNDDKDALARLLPAQEELKKRIESKEFRKDLAEASSDFKNAFNALHKDQSAKLNTALQGLVEMGRKMPLEQFPQDLPRGIRGVPISNEQFRSLVNQGELKVDERKLAENEMPALSDLTKLNRILLFNDAADQELKRAVLEHQWTLTIRQLSELDSSGELAKKWFPEKVEDLSNELIEKRLAAAAPWMQKGAEVRRYAELHHRFQKMVDGQFTLPWLGIPSHWDASAIEKNKDVVSVAKNEKTGNINVNVVMPESLDRNDENMARIQKMDEWLKKYKGPVDQALSQIEGSKAENSVLYWGDVKTEMRVDRDGAIVEKGWKDAAGRQVFQESDGRKYRISDGNKEFVPASEKLESFDYRVVNGQIVPLKAGEEIKDVNLMEFRTEAKAVSKDGQPMIEIKQVQTLQYAHWASYQGWGWVSDVKKMGGDIKAQQIDKDMSIAEDKGVAGGRRDGKKGDYLVTLEDGRQQFINAESFKQQYKEKAGQPGQYEEMPRYYKPDDWVVVFRSDSGGPQPTLMQAKDVPSFCSSQARWHYGTKVVTTGVDFLMLASGVAEVKAAMIGIEATAAKAAEMSTAKVLSKALLTRQGLTGALHTSFGVTGFAGQGIENLGPGGHAFMQGRAWLMMADLSYTAIGRPFSGKPFIPTAEQIAKQGFFSQGVLKFSEVLSGQSKAARLQALAVDGFFIAEMGVRQLPGIVNRARGTDVQQVQQRQALERRWPQSTLAEDRKSPSSFDKQTMMRVDAFKKPTEEALKLAENDPKRVEFNKKLIETVKNEKADSRDRLGAAFALLSLNVKDGKLAEKISANDAVLEREQLNNFIDAQRYLQAKEVLDGYREGLKAQSSPELQNKLDKLSSSARLSMSDIEAERNLALSELLNTFKSETSSSEEKVLAASAILFARRRESDGTLSEKVSAGGKELQAKELVDFLYAAAQAKNGERANPGHLRLFAGDMLLRLDIDRFSAADMTQICMSIVNDKNEPADPAAKERFNQLKLQAMVDSHGFRLADLYELMKSRIEPELANMPTADSESLKAKGLALAALQGRDSDSIRKTLESLRGNADARVSALASYVLYAGNCKNPTERIERVSELQNPGSQLKWPESNSKDAQDKWVKTSQDFILSKLKAELPFQAGRQYDQVSADKFRAAQELIAKYPDLKSNSEIQNDINTALQLMITGDNPQLAADALPLLLSRMKAYNELFKGLKAEEMTPGLKSIRERLFDKDQTLATLRSSTSDLLTDASTFSTYASRAENLAKDLDTLRNDYESKKATLSESQKSEMEARIAELAQAFTDASRAPVELKKALLKNLPDILALSKANGGAADIRASLDAVQVLTQVRDSNPETVSPDLRTQAIQTLIQLGANGPAVVASLSKSLADDPSPKVRLSALEALQKVNPDDLQKICLTQLAKEQHPEITKRLREMEFSNRRPDPDSAEYKQKFEKARAELISQSARSLTGAELYLKSSPEFRLLDGQSLRNQALAEVQDNYFKGVAGFLRYNLDGDKGVDDTHGKILDKYAGRMREQMESLGRKAATDDEALKALAYIAISNGRPLLKDDRRWGAEKAAEKIKEICQNSSPERARQIAWTVENLLLNQPSLSAAGRQNAIEGLKALLAKPGQAGLSDSQVSTILAQALQRELRNTPAPGAKDFAEREKLQADILALLSENRFRNKEILPVLEAIADGVPKFKVQRAENGDVLKVQYPDGSTREILRSGNNPSKYIFKDSAGKETVWLPEPGKPNTWYKESDKEKKEPWTGTHSFDKITGDYVQSSESGKVRFITKANGAMLEYHDNKVSKVTYPDGSSRHFEPAGENFTRMTFSSSDGKTKEVWQKEANSDTFYKDNDPEKKAPWKGRQYIDAASGDYVTVQGQERTVHSVDGAVSRIKDGKSTDIALRSSFAYNTSIASVRQKAQELYSAMADRSDSIRLSAQLPPGANPALVASRISDEIVNSKASSERVGRAIALSEKLGPINDDKDPRRAPLQIAAGDGHELVRLMAARELMKSINAEDRKLAYTVLTALEKQGSRPGYVKEANELLGQALLDVKVSADEKQGISNLRQEAQKLDAATYKSRSRLADLSADLDYQDSFERATRSLKENAMRTRNLSKYEGSDNWFSKNENYSLLDHDKLKAAQAQADKDAQPGFIPWIFTRQSTIDKRVEDALQQVWTKQEKQLGNLGEQAKLAGEAGREAREALVSIILTQGQPFKESDRSWAVKEASKMIRNCIKDGHPGSRDLIWALQVALIEEPSLDPGARFHLMNAVDHAQKRGILDAKEASLLMAAALESEYQGMPSKARNAAANKESLDNQQYAITLIGNWGNVEASPVLEAIANHHPEPAVKKNAASALLLLKMKR